MIDCLRTRHIANITSRNLQGAIRELVEPDATIMIDDERSYLGLWKVHPGEHHRINHTRSEYARGHIHTNTIEGFFSTLKRGVFGTYHSISKAHLHRYLAEFEYRYNTRGVDDGERVARLVRQAEGKRLRYVDSVVRI